MLRALIVEDSEDDALLLVQKLRRGGYEVSSERVDSAEAMNAALASTSWDIIFSDYTMPHFRGTEALNLLSQSGLDIPFIFVSGTMGEEIAVAAMKAGAHDYIMKGNLKRLLPAVERELREARVRFERRRAEEELRRRDERARALHDLNLAITSTLDLPSVLNLFLEKVETLLPHAAAATLHLLNAEGGELEPVARGSFDQAKWKPEEWKPGNELAKRVVEKRALVRVENVRVDPRTWNLEFFPRQGLVSYVGVSLIAKNEMLGVLSLYLKEGLPWNEEESEFLTTLANQAAIAIHNSQLYESSRKLIAQLEQANQVKSEFLSMISHELRTPLNVIIGYSGMIRERFLPDQTNAIEKIAKYSGDLWTMIESILDASRIEAGAASAQFGPVHLNDFMDELKTVYDLPMEKDLKLVWDVPASLPEIVTDRDKLRHIVQNLINNALKFTSSGEVRISVRCLPDRGIVEFRVADTGIGISADELSTIFEIFRQADGAAKRSHGGVGLGLYIVKTFTQMLGGRVEVESEPGKGSAFTVAIPIRPK